MDKNRLFSSPDMVTQLSFSTEKHILQVGYMEIDFL